LFYACNIEKVQELERRREIIVGSSLDTVEKIYWLIEDCKRYGTLPFAGLARAGFIAVQILMSLVNIGVLDQDDYDNFMCSLDTINSRMKRDFKKMKRNEFLKIYGHLRPGSYDILSPRYDEAPDRYFNWTEKDNIPEKCEIKSFSCSLDQMKKIDVLLKEHGLEYDVVGLFSFIKEAIESRENSKFIFTKSLSETLSMFKQLAGENGFSAEDASFSDITCIKQLYASTSDTREALEQTITEGKKKYNLTKQITLPPILLDPDDVWAFHLPQFEPNFITVKNAAGKVISSDMDKNLFQDAILFIPCADPGFDWIFSHNIKAFVTMYGGANSHMAIRACELGIPAVIGTGEFLYKKWASASSIEIDCANKQVRILK